MANTKSLEKVKKYLEERKSAVAPTQISQDTFLKPKSVQECLKILSDNNQVLIVSSDSGHSLVQIKQVQNECDNYATISTAV